MTLPYTVTQLKKDIQTGHKFTYVFFWGGPFSQWKMANFEVDGIIYNCAEQYMMAEKARLFGDDIALRKILSSPYPKSQKELGRQVKNYDDAEWNKIRKQVVIKGNIAKFSQNKSLYKSLMNTDDSIIVEASPEDRIWGIDLGTRHPDRLDPFKWQGLNLLGFCLMKVREKLAT